MKCITCKKDKPEEEFIWADRKLELRGARCRLCQNAYSKQHYRLHKQDYLKRNRLRRNENRTKLAQLKSSTPCADCHQKYPSCAMDFHHLRNKRLRIQPSQQWETLVKEIKKCVLLCANCHRIRTHA